MTDTSSPLLIDESPLQVLPSLVVVLGNVNEAIILQQVQYWLKNPKSGRYGEDGRKYIRDTYEEWQKQIPWLSVRSLKGRIKSLQNKGLLLTANLNKSKYDRTKWYSINYTNLNVLMQGEDSSSSKVKQSHDQTGSKLPIKSEVSYQPIPKTSTKTSTESSINKYNVQEQSSVDHIPYQEVIEYLNKKTGKHYKSTSKANQKFIRGRWNDGYKLEDFKKVIDKKASEWQGTKMAHYLRPETLFNATKFESYINEESNDRVPKNGGFAGIESSSDVSQPKLQEIPDDELPF